MEQVLLLILVRVTLMSLITFKHRIVKGGTQRFISIRVRVFLTYEARTIIQGFPRHHDLFQKIPLNLRHAYIIYRSENGHYFHKGR